MNEYRVIRTRSSVRQGDLFARLSLWGMVAGLLGIGIFAAYGPRSTVQSFSVPLALLAGLIATGAIVLVFLLVFHHAWEKGISEWSFILTDCSLIRKRKGWPDITIPLAEITGIYVRKKYLEVESSVLNRRIIVPREIEGFDSLEKALSKCKVPVPRASYKTFGWPVALLYAICCALVLWSKLLPITFLAAAVGLILLGRQSFYWYTYIKRYPKMVRAGVAIICFEWLGAVLIAFFRLIHS